MMKSTILSEPMLIAALFSPLIGAFLSFFFPLFVDEWRKKKIANLISVFFIVFAALAATFLFYHNYIGGEGHVVVMSSWIRFNKFSVDWAFLLDPLSTSMLALVHWIAAFIQIYAIGYMRDDRSVPRFMAFMSLFSFFMAILVCADNLFQMFVGWEGVGLCSYLLINFWYEKEAANKAGIKAFLVNKLADSGFILGMFGCAVVFGSVRIPEIISAAPSHINDYVSLGYIQHSVLELLCFSFFVAAMGKSAQLFFHVWLPDAMEGPTPVSALIHAATMVTAGVFLLARLSFLFELAPSVLLLIALWGAATAVYGGVVASMQTDIKRIIAYSTISQLGIMMVAIGFSAYHAAMFHLSTHAFFKALLFLGAGSVIHALHGEQDIRKMGGLAPTLPLTTMAMWCGVLAMTAMGVPNLFGFSGFYSKELIMASISNRHDMVGVLILILMLMSSFLTAYYSLRLMLCVFYRPLLQKVEGHVQSLFMSIPLMVFSLGAIVAGAFMMPWIVDPSFWRSSIIIASRGGNDQHVMPFVFSIAGMVAAFIIYVLIPKYKPTWDAVMAKRVGLIDMIEGGFGLDRLLSGGSQSIAQGLGNFFSTFGDEALLDKNVLHGVSRHMVQIGRKVEAWQSGRVYHYAYVMIGGVVFYVSYVWIGSIL